MRSLTRAKKRKYHDTTMICLGGRPFYAPKDSAVNYNSVVVIPAKWTVRASELPELTRGGQNPKIGNPDQWLLERMIYRDRLKSVQILLSRTRTQARPSRKVKQDQEEISRNRIPSLKPIYIHSTNDKKRSENLNRCWHSPKEPN